jgi:hypothetical protein
VFSRLAQPAAAARRADTVRIGYGTAAFIMYSFQTLTFFAKDNTICYRKVGTHVYFVVAEQSLIERAIDVQSLVSEQSIIV